MAQASTKLSRLVGQRLSQRLKYVLMDCDGVIWYSHQSIPGAREAVQKLRDKGLKIGFVTNNSTLTRATLLEKFKAYNIQALPNEIFSVNHLAAMYLKAKGISGRLYMIGHSALYDELRAAGFDCNQDGPDPMDGCHRSWRQMKLDQNVVAVIVGFENHFSMAKVCRAATYLRNPECIFVATDSDSRIADPRSIIAAIQVPTGRNPEIIGKPSVLMMDLIRKWYPDLAGENTLFIGDNLETDIEFGRRNGFLTLLVESGVHNRHHISESCNTPTFYTPSIADIIEFME